MTYDFYAVLWTLTFTPVEGGVEKLIKYQWEYLEISINERSSADSLSGKEIYWKPKLKGTTHLLGSVTVQQQ